MMRTLRSYSLNNFPIYHTVVLLIVITLYITALVLVYLITGSIYLLTTFFQFPLPPRTASSNHKTNLFFCEFVGFF